MEEAGLGTQWRKERRYEELEGAWGLLVCGTRNNSSVWWGVQCMGLDLVKGVIEVCMHWPWRTIESFCCQFTSSYQVGFRVWPGKKDRRFGHLLTEKCFPQLEQTLAPQKVGLCLVHMCPHCQHSDWRERCTEHMVSEEWIVESFYHPPSYFFFTVPTITSKKRNTNLMMVI